MNRTRCSHIPDDLIIDIFLNLPAKSLIRFRSLSKSWKARITDSSFTMRHHSVAKDRFDGGKPSFMLLEKLDGSESVRKTTFEIDKIDRTKLVRSYESRVIQLRKIRRVKNDYSEQWTGEIGYSSGICCLYRRNGDATLWNPATRDLKKVEFQRVLDDTNFNVGFGFGLILHSGAADIKMVWLNSVECNQGWRVRFQVYTLSTGSWHWAKPSIAANTFHETGIEVNGVLHWLAIDSTRDAEECMFILTFDLKNETCGRIELPLNFKSCFGCGKEIRASLDVRSQTLELLGYGAETIDLWIRKDESWVNQVRVIFGVGARIEVLGYCSLIDGIFMQNYVNQEMVLHLTNTFHRYEQWPAAPTSVMFGYAENLMPIEGCSWQKDLLRKYSL